MTGRINAVAADPSNANTIYTGAAGGGVWKTVDGGTNWAPLTDSQLTLSTGAIAIAPSNSSTLFVGTGDPAGAVQSLYGRGALWSGNGGATWVQLSSFFNKYDITKIVVDPTNPSTVYTAVTGGGTNGDSSATGIWRSTNSGSTWTNTTSLINATDRWSDLAIDPSNRLHLIASLCGGSTKSGLYVTTNGGTNWTLINTGAPVGASQSNSRVAFAPSNGQIVYASFSGPDGNALGIWKSTNGGTSWGKLANVPEYFNGHGVYDQSLAVSPADPDVVYAGGNSKLLQSVDGGQTWNDVTVGAGGITGTGIEHEALAFDANGKLLDATGNGIFRLDNASPGTVSWSDLNGNLNIARVMSVVTDPATADHLVATASDTGVVQYSGTLTWTQSEGGIDGGIILQSPQNPNRLYRQLPFTGATAGSFLRRSDDGGVTWTPITSGIYTLDPQATFAPLAVDPGNGNHLVFGTNKVYESVDGGNNWTAISQPYANGWTVGVAGTVSSLSIWPDDPNTILAIAGGAVLVTHNHGAAWTAQTPTNPPDRLVSDTSKVVYALRGAFGGSKVLRTSDGGATWSDLTTNNLPDLPADSIASSGPNLYLGTDSGVYFSGDDGRSWTKFGASLPNVPVRDLKFDPVHNILVAATAGRGVWEISTAGLAPLVVNTLTDDTTPSNGLLSLREAVAAVGASGQPIAFDPSISGGTISLDPANGTLIIGNSISILGPGAGLLTVSATTASKIQVPAGANVTFSGLILTGTGTVLQIDSTGSAKFINGSLGAAVTDNGSLTFDQLADGGAAASISGSGSVAKVGPYALTLTGTNTYTGGTTLWAGALTGTTLAVQGNLTDSPGATLVFDQTALPGAAGTYTGSLSGGGTVRVAGPSSRVSKGQGAFAPGALVIDAGATYVVGFTNSLSGTTVCTVNGNLDLNGVNVSIAALQGASTGAVYSRNTQSGFSTAFTIAGSLTTTYSGVLEDVRPGSGDVGMLFLYLNGNFGALTLDGTTPNTYTGGTNVQNGGGLFGNSRTIEGSYNVQSGLTIDQSLGGVGDGTTRINVSGGGALLIGPGTVRLAPGSTIATTGRDNAVIGTLICPPAGGAINAFTYFQITGALDLNGGDESTGLIVGTGTITNSHAGLATLTLESLGDYTFAGTITDDPAGGGGTVALVLHRSPTVTLQGDNRFSGGTTLGGGQLAVGPSQGNPLGSGPVTLASTTSSPVTLSLQGRMSTPLQQPLTVTGFNQDVIAEASAASAMAGTSIPFDGLGAGLNNVWYEAGFGGAFAAGTGLPAGGSVINSPVTPAVSFRLPNYTGNNVGMMTVAQPSVTLTLGTPSAFQSLNFLTCAGGGNASIQVYLNFADGTSTLSGYLLSDWLGGADPVLSAGGMVSRTAGTSVTRASANPRMYEFDLRLAPADQIKILKSITFKLGAGSNAGVFAVSGSAWSLQGAQSFGNAVRVMKGANLNVFNSPVAGLGPLTVNNAGADISVAGPALWPVSLAFPGVLFQSNGKFVPSAGAALSLGGVADGGGGFSLVTGGAGTIELSSTNAYGGATSVTGGTLLVDVPSGLPAQSDLSVTGNGLVRLRPGGGAAQIHTLTLAVGSRFDIADNTLRVHFATASADDHALLQTYLANGYDAGKWDGIGSGIDGAVFSSTAAADASRCTGIGYTLALADLPDGTPANTVVLTYDLYGDANLDHKVDSTDAMILARNYLTVASTWDAGDFNYDSAVNYADALLLQKNFGATLAAGAAGAAGATPAGTTPTGTTMSTGGTTQIDSSPTAPVTTTTTSVIAQDSSDLTRKKQKERHPLHSKHR